MNRSDDSVQFTLEVLNSEAGNESLAKITDVLSAQLLRNPGVANLEKVRTDGSNTGSKSAAEVAALGAFVLSLLPTVLPEIVKWLQVWTTRDRRNTIKLKKQVGDRLIELELSADTPKEKIQEFLDVVSKNL